MFFPKIDAKNDPARRWHRPDRHFFANGACQVLAFAFLERYPDLGFRARWIKPAAGFTGNHIYVTNGINAFDYHGFTTEQRLLALGSNAAAGFFPAGTQRWWICRPRFWCRNSARGRSRGFGCESRSNSSMMPCRALAISSTDSAISNAGWTEVHRLKVAVHQCETASLACSAESFDSLST